MSHNKSISWLLMLNSSPLSHDSFVKIPVVNRYIYVCMCICSCVCVYIYIYTRTYIYVCVCVCFNCQCCVCEKPKSSWGHAYDLHGTTVILFWMQDIHVCPIYGILVWLCVWVLSGSFSSRVQSTTFFIGEFVE